MKTIIAMKIWFISMLFLAAMACAQTVTITGTVLDPTGRAYDNGTGKVSLTPGSVNWLVNGTNPVTSPLTIAALDSSGKFSIPLTNTAVIQPSSMSREWQFSFCSQSSKGQLPVCFTMTPMALTSSQDISTAIQAQSALLPGSGGGTPGGSPVFQVKPTIDVRDWGVDCTGVADAAAILNSHTNTLDGITGDKITIPNGCVLNLTSGRWLIYGSAGWEIDGSGILSTSSLIKYCGPAGADSTLKIERSAGWTIRGVTIESTDTGCSNPSATAVTVDNDMSGAYTTTDGVFDRVYLEYDIHGGTGAANWTGLNLSPTSGANVEDMRLLNSHVSCQGASNSSGVNLNASFNAKMEEFHHTQFSACTYGVNQQNGSMFLAGMDTGDNGSAVALGAASDPTLVEAVTSEDNQLSYVTQGANWPATLIASHAGWSGISGSSSGLCGMDFGSWGQAGGNYILIGNGTSEIPTGAFPLCSGISPNLTMIGNQFLPGNGVTPSGSTGFILPAGHTFGNSYSVLNGGYMRMGHDVNNGNGNIGYGFFTQFGMEVGGYGFNAQSLDDSHSGSTRVGHDVMYLGNDHITLKGMWPIPSSSVNCSYAGTTGSATWYLLVFAVDAAGKRGGLYYGPGNSNVCYNGSSTLNSSNQLTAVWPRVTGAVSYDVVVMNPSNPGAQGILGVNVSDPGSGQTATATFPTGSNTITTGSTFNYSFPGYADSAITSINGERLTVNTPTTFTGAVTVSNLNIVTNVAISGTAPTVSSGFGSNPSIPNSNGTAAFTINVGTGGTATGGVIGFPTASNGWAVHCDDVTTQSTSVARTAQTATSVTSATLTQYSDAAVPSAWGSGDVLVCQAMAY